MSIINPLNPLKQATKLSAGTGITIEDNAISVDTPVRGVYTQEEYDALPEEQKSSGLYIVNGGSAPTSIFPPGGIIIWSGAADAIPDGWILCDGENGTPDLRNRFVLGAGNREVGETGGSEEVTLTEAQMPSHAHAQTVGNSGSTPDCIIANSGNITGGRASKYKTQSSGSSQPHPNMPPYYVLCYIMKL